MGAGRWVRLGTDGEGRGREEAHKSRRQGKKGRRIVKRALLTVQGLILRDRLHLVGKLHWDGPFMKTPPLPSLFTTARKNNKGSARRSRRGQTSGRRRDVTYVINKSGAKKEEKQCKLVTRRRSQSL